MIRSNTHAFELLETSDDVPYEAIRYLYYQKPNETIHEKVIYWLENAYNDEMIDEGGFDPNTPFWYAILAEKYIDEKLIEPIIKLFTTVESDWDYLNEQAVRLIQNLCEKIGDKVIAPFLNAVVEQVQAESKLPYLYLFESFRFVDPAKYSEQILSLLETKSYWLEALLAHLPYMQFSQKKHAELLEKIAEKVELLRLNYEMMESLDHIDRGILRQIITTQKEFSEVDYPDVTFTLKIKPKDWEATIRAMDRFSEDDDEPINNIAPSPVPTLKKIGRNDPCSCGSGKKYKRCCL